jgi:hypothetical protein
MSLNENDKPESLFVCPLNKSNGDPFPIKTDQGNKVSDLDFNDHTQIQIHIIGETVLITSLFLIETELEDEPTERTFTKSILTRLDFSEGIQQQSKATRKETTLAKGHQNFKDMYTTSLTTDEYYNYDSDEWTQDLYFLIEKTVL